MLGPWLKWVGLKCQGPPAVGGVNSQLCINPQTHSGNAVGGSVCIQKGVVIPTALSQVFVSVKSVAELRDQNRRHCLLKHLD